MFILWAVYNRMSLGQAKVNSPKGEVYVLRFGHIAQKLLVQI